ncbi:hypothetical protein VNO77_08977 [Canavalia gladiata]|uniref:Uncharacterized protein n=1 Tax=Canavalia gladiata TaxID=3824 RepID=A0AAN9ME98_CANGL
MNRICDVYIIADLTSLNSCVLSNPRETKICSGFAPQLPKRSLPSALLKSRLLRTADNYKNFYWQRHSHSLYAQDQNWPLYWAPFQYYTSNWEAMQYCMHGDMHVQARLYMAFQNH